MATYQDWEKTVSESIRGDMLWKMRVYRLSLFASDISWSDATTLIQDKRTLNLADQLYRAIGSIGANIAEGYSRSSGKDRARFYEYALGSAREGRDWYYKARHLLGPDVTEHRLELLSQIIRLILTMLPDQRQQVIKEETIAYGDILNEDVEYPSDSQCYGVDSRRQSMRSR